MMVAAGGNKGRLLTITLGELESENLAIEPQRALEIGHLQVDMADSNPRINAHFLSSTKINRRLIASPLTCGLSR